MVSNLKSEGGQCELEERDVPDRRNIQGGDSGEQVLADGRMGSHQVGEPFGGHDGSEEGCES